MSAIMEDPALPDADGDFPVRGVTAQGWVRVEAHHPWGVQVFALAAHGVPTKLAVLREINEASASDRAVRVVLRPGGWLSVEYRLLADAVTQDNLRDMLGHVLAVTDDIGPMIAAVHGGATPITASSSAPER